MNKVLWLIIDLMALSVAFFVWGHASNDAIYGLALVACGFALALLAFDVVIPE